MIERRLRHEGAGTQPDRDGGGHVHQRARIGPEASTPRGRIADHVVAIGQLQLSPIGAVRAIADVPAGCRAQLSQLEEAQRIEGGRGRLAHGRP